MCLQMSLGLARQMGIWGSQEGTDSRRDQPQLPSPCASYCRVASCFAFTLWLCPRGLPKTEPLTYAQPMAKHHA